MAIGNDQNESEGKNEQITRVYVFQMSFFEIIFRNLIILELFYFNLLILLALLYPETGIDKYVLDTLRLV